MARDASADGDLATVYRSEAFYMHCFKILPCSKRYAHDWTSCPFAHPSEKARRRNPRAYNYDCEMCPAVARGEVCELGQACPHSHHVFESWLHPQRFRTSICKDGDACKREVCFFAHGAEQLRTPSRDPQFTRSHPLPSLGPSSVRPAASSAAAGVVAWPPAPQAAGHAAGRVAHFSSASSTAQSPRAAAAAAAFLQPQARGGGALSSGQEGASSMVPSVMPVLLPMGAASRLAVPPGTVPAPSSPGSSCDSLPGVYDLLSSLVAELKVTRQQAQESRAAADAAQGQLRALVSALGSAAEPQAPPAAAAASAPLPVQLVPVAGMDAASMMQHMGSMTAGLGHGSMAQQGGLAGAMSSASAGTWMGVTVPPPAALVSSGGLAGGVAAASTACDSTLAQLPGRASAPVVLGAGALPGVIMSTPAAYSSDQLGAAVAAASAAAGSSGGGLQPMLASDYLLQLQVPQGSSSCLTAPQLAQTWAGGEGGSNSAGTSLEGLLSPSAVSDAAAGYHQGGSAASNQYTGWL